MHILVPFLLLACSGSPSVKLQQPPASSVTPASVLEVLAPLGLDRLATDSALGIEQGEESPYEGYGVRPLSFLVRPGFRTSAALWLPEGDGPFPGVLVLPGHFGEGKASGECQEVAHALAARGYAVLAVDMPGVEEWEIPARQLHFRAGAHNRAALVAAGSSALGLQLAIAQRGLDALLEAAPVDRVAATGASGGAVLAFYLALLDPRVQAVALASWVDIPRDPASGGCFCDVLPGASGPDPALLAALGQPSLWLSEIERPAPEGLPTSARYAVVPGPHSYTAPMRALALPWLDEQLGHTPPAPRRARQVLAEPPHTPGAALRSATDHDAGSITELALAIGQPRPWTPRPDVPTEVSATCPSAGDPIIALGVELRDLMALRAAGFAACDMKLDDDETWEPRALATGHALVDREASAAAQLSAQLGGAPIYAVGPWAVAAAASGVPWVGRVPLHAIEQVDPKYHPAWVHVPGGWWGGLDTLYGSAIAIADESGPLIEALRARAE